ncbi:DUF547 domain-containing protein [Dokdonia donghaensis]|uniref:DUF547 domain-containing protein n=1 Tax=Dokdonia donghaensis DSW-1 TaxID=1300343 RepID=A0A0A2H1F7_9FLAO|nr:DUF547 domain-containing protein [Dokdonia donghaensis]ANH59066.1 hypothetical protein I597_0131 [Dokdonia donghaensis DSW-1]KGO06495.1 hypothetical protein NV36_06350 [Dokdonia donghaensis DSW-1]
MKIVTFLFTLLVINSMSAQSTDVFFTDADVFFKEYIKNGRVDYAAVQSNPESLDKLLAVAQTIKVSKTDAKTYQAFWINAYNLSVIKGILAKYPVKQPLSIKGFFDKQKHAVGGSSITLNDIENEKLRAVFPDEARFHFVLVCAGLGCPPIINEAYMPSKLEAQLQRQTKLALNNPSFIRVKGKKVQISQIFEWYNVDFTRSGSVLEFINKYRDSKIDETAKLSYYPYDWTLNDIK